MYICNYFMIFVYISTYHIGICLTCIHLSSSTHQNTSHIHVTMCKWLRCDTCRMVLQGQLRGQAGRASRASGAA